MPLNNELKAVEASKEKGKLHQVLLWEFLHEVSKIVTCSMNFSPVLLKTHVVTRYIMLRIVCFYFQMMNGFKKT